jgi:cardiolipin synthase
VLVLVVLATVVATVLVVLVVQNLLARGHQITYRIGHEYRVGSPEFVRAMSVLLGPPMLEGNRITALQNGDEIFPAMLDAIRGARETINFETYIYWEGAIGREMAEALAERARAGVEVRVLLDWAGAAKADKPMVERMREAGAEVVWYHPLRWYNLGRLNNRTHRKLLVVDGRIGFTGGVGIADEWLGRAQDERHWRDSHYRVEGPTVAQMQAAFLDNWMETQGQVLHGEKFFPEAAAERAGPHFAQMFMSSDDGGSESVRLMYLLSIAAATRSIRLANAYFVPDRLAVEMLVAARERGVEIDILVPGGHIDFKIVRRASRALWGPLLRAGIRIHEYTPTMLHQKIVVIDDCWVSVGSTNFDNRSFRLNDEANLNILDEEFAAAQAAIFDADLKRGRQITYEMWRRRPWRDKAKEWLATRVRGQL